jgi:hypothetical protein
MHMIGRTLQLSTAAALLLSLTLSQAKAQDDTELAKKTQNPVADLIGVPLQSNFNFGAGSKERMIYILNVQPVIPIHITENWNLITRVIMPIINQPALFPGMDSATGPATPTDSAAPVQNYQHNCKPAYRLPIAQSMAGDEEPRHQTRTS